MSQNETLAAAAHLHVLLRRKTGRVTDTEWMASNAEYAHAIVRFARDQAANEGHAELLPLAERLETLVETGERQRRPLPANAPAPRVIAVPTTPHPMAAEALNTRYIGRLR